MSRAVVAKSVTQLYYEPVAALGMLALMKTKDVFSKSAACWATTDYLTLEPVDFFDLSVFATFVD